MVNCMVNFLAWKSCLKFLQSNIWEDGNRIKLLLKFLYCLNNISINYTCYFSFLLFLNSLKVQIMICNLEEYKLCILLLLPLVGYLDITKPYPAVVTLTAGIPSVFLSEHCSASAFTLYEILVK